MICGTAARRLGRSGNAFRLLENKSIFLTGHTGFKGGWIAHWLTELGAHVHGYALAPPTEPNFFTETRLQERIASSTIDDIRDLENLAKAVKQAKPEIVIHGCTAFSARVL